MTVPPEAPAIINGDALRTTEDTRIEVECVSRGGKPAAEVGNNSDTFRVEEGSRKYL